MHNNFSKSHESRNTGKDQELKNFYNKSRNYLERLRKHDENTFAEYIKLCKNEILSGGKILECGCGMGLSSSLLAQNGFNVTAIDISELFIQEAKNNYLDNNNPEFCVQDVSKLEFPDSMFDAVCSFDFIEHVADVEIAMKEMGRVTKNGGILIISTPNHLYPISYLKEFVKWKSKKYYRPWEARSRLIAFQNLTRSVFLIILKIFFINRKLYYVDPVLSDNRDACGRDFDITWLSNYIDLKRILKNLKFRMKRPNNQNHKNKPFYRRIILEIMETVKHVYNNNKRYCVVIGEKCQE